MAEGFYAKIKELTHRKDGCEPDYSFLPQDPNDKEKFTETVKIPDNKLINKDAGVDWVEHGLHIYIMASNAKVEIEALKLFFDAGFEFNDSYYNEVHEPEVMKFIWEKTRKTPRWYSYLNYYLDNAKIDNLREEMIEFYAKVPINYRALVEDAEESYEDELYPKKLEGIQRIKAVIDKLEAEHPGAREWNDILEKESRPYLPNVPLSKWTYDRNAVIDGYTLVMAIIENGEYYLSTKPIQLAIDGGCDVKLLNENNVGALQIALTRKCEPDVFNQSAIFKILLENGADVNGVFKEKDIITTYLKECESRDDCEAKEEIVKLFLEHGVNPNGEISAQAREYLESKGLC